MSRHSLHTSATPLTSGEAKTEHVRGLRIERAADRLQVAIRWRRWPLVVGLGLLLFLWFVRVGLAVVLEPSPGYLRVGVTLWVGALLQYLWWACWLNRTVIELDARVCAVRYGPLPWPGGRLETLAQIERLELKTRRVRLDFRLHQTPDAPPTYALRAVLRSGDVRTLFTSRDLHQANHLYALMQQFLADRKAAHVVADAE